MRAAGQLGFAVLLLTVVAAIASQQRTEASPQLPFSAVPSGFTIQVTFTIQDDLATDSSVTLRAQTGLGNFTTSSAIGGCTAASVSALAITYSDSCIDSLVDGNGDINAYQGVAIFNCTTSGLVTFMISQPTDQNTLTTSAQCSGAGGSGSSIGQVVVIATPNALNCGGTVSLKAGLRNTLTGALDTAVFHFELGTGTSSSTITVSQSDAALLTQLGNDTARLVVLANQPFVSVTATTIGLPLNPDPANPNKLEALHGTVFIFNTCGNAVQPAGVQTPAIALTASPNVINCGGTSTITATARDNSGHIIPGVAFHFSADSGGLISQPNNASATANSAVLSIAPGMGKAEDGVADEGIRSVTVTAYMGEKYNTIKVQQYCPGVNVDTSVAPGKITLSVSNSQLSCNDSAFIGATIRDSKGQVPREVKVDFLATSGGFIESGGGGSSSSSSSSGSSSNSTISTSSRSDTQRTVSATTRDGTLNVIYLAGSTTTGEVTISAAAGTAFGSAKVQVNCPGAIVSGASGSGGGSFASGSSSGFGGIRPPNTGDGGLLNGG